MINWYGWTNWAQLENLDFKEVPSKPGAYAIAANRPLNRAVGTNEEGILDVGESEDLNSRLWAFCQCARGKGKVEGHMAGWRYAYFNLGEHFPFSSLLIRWIVKSTKVEAQREEARLLRAYIENHFELPPLNYKFNWKTLEQD